MPLRKELQNLGRPPRIVLLGSGGLTIGQAGEFDYSGSQAIRALREEGIEVLVVNPNIATVQTNPIPGVRIFLYPVEAEWVKKIIREYGADGIVAGFGGQTALNCLLALEECGFLAEHGVINLGSPPETLRLTEDRKRFADRMREIEMPTLKNRAVYSVDEAIEASREIGFPMIVRAAYALGGLGSGFAADASELAALTKNALALSPQVLIERSLAGWKELEYEVMVDSTGNAITICNMENIDPLGIHTGDSIVIAPSQTLNDPEYQTLRDAAIRIATNLGVLGECNVQFALDPHSRDFFVIEVNARLSRSSALASKATGYPIAYIAAKVVLGYELTELKNPVTGVTSAFYEPALDYVAVKIPRWEMSKFPGSSRHLGSSMKSVGEVMGIGRSFQEALQKAVRMVTERAEGISAAREKWTDDRLREELRRPSDVRLHALMAALREGRLSTTEIHELTRIDPWFIARLREIAVIEEEIRSLTRPSEGAPIAIVSEAVRHVAAAEWLRWKQAGFGDAQIAWLLLSNSSSPGEATVNAAASVLREKRLGLGVRPVVKRIDTTAAEYPSPSNYVYMTYHGSESDSIPSDSTTPAAVIVGGGAYRIGSSVEFDWGAVGCSQELRRIGWRSVMLNCNPETVSTDYHSSDLLYFEEPTTERILDVLENEKARGVILAFGGQLSNRLSGPLTRSGAKLLGHSEEAIETTEDRTKFSALLDRLGIDQPRWVSATARVEIESFVEANHFPVLVRPSHVLSGSAMNVAMDEKSLERCLAIAREASPDFPVVISKFLEEAWELELDAVAAKGQVLESAVCEHIEHAGVHSGDATMVIPPRQVSPSIVARLQAIGAAIAGALELSGPFNIQFLVKGDVIKVIECNARASRSLPFVSKMRGIDFSRTATRAIVGEAALPRTKREVPPRFGVKAAMFSFGRMPGTDPILGVEMVSTGEVGCFAPTFEEALLLALQSSGIGLPRKGILLSAGPVPSKARLLGIFHVIEKLRLPVFATTGTAAYFQKHGKQVVSLEASVEEGMSASQAIREGWVDFVINIPKNLSSDELGSAGEIRKLAIQHGCSLITDLEKAISFFLAAGACPNLIRSHAVVELSPMT